MPCRQGDSFIQAAVGTIFRQPAGDLRKALRRDLCTGRHLLKTLRITFAMNGFLIQVRADDRSIKHLMRILIPDLIQAAKTAAVAKQFPFILRKKASQPKPVFFQNHTSTITDSQVLRIQ